MQESSWFSSAQDGGEGAYAVHSEAGGGHAHSGCMIYLGDNWPQRYRGGVFMCNLHGNRINHDILERKGSTYVARHGKDFMHANDPWFRGLSLMYGPDGGVYVADWCDTGECHNYEVAHTTSGRIYKITYGKAKPWKGDLAKMSDEELVDYQALFSSEDWHSRTARRILQERASHGTLAAESRGRLLRTIKERPSLRVLWSLHVTGGVPEKVLRWLVNHPYLDENLRAWAVRIGFENSSNLQHSKTDLLVLAYNEPSALVRLELAAGMQRLNTDEIYSMANTLLRHHEDDGDPYIPLMTWYGLEPLVAASRKNLDETERLYPVFVIKQSKIPLIREFIARRIGSLYKTSANWNDLIELLGERDSVVLRDLLRGIEVGLQGERKVPMPEAWKKVFPLLMQSPLKEINERAIALAVQFGDKRALDLLRKTALDAKSSPQSRQHALQHLVFNQSKDLVPLLHQLLSDKSITGAAIRGLGAFDDPKTPALILKRYPSLTADEKADAVHTLASRPKYALALLDAVEAKTVPRGDLSAFTVRQIQALKDAKVNERLTQVWGTLRDPSKDRAAVIGKWKKALTKEVLERAKPASGRALYKTHCAACHKLFDDGGAIGPDLTGSQRFNLDYVLENMIDPSAVVPKDYQVTIIATNNGRVLTGIIKQETDRAVTVQTQNELVVVPKDEIDSRTQSNLSMMPEGVLDQLSIEQVRDLVAYLASPAQTPLAK